MLASAAIRHNPQSALPKMQHRFKRSNLELRGPSNSIKTATGTPERCTLRFCSRISCRRNG
eukprot:2431218-Alexandrium_andersonii.AAC.1